MYQVIDDVTARGISASVAKPLLAAVAHDHAVRLVDAAVLAGVVGQLLAVVKLFVVLLELELAEGGGSVGDLARDARRWLRDSIHLNRKNASGCMLLKYGSVCQGGNQLL